MGHPGQIVEVALLRQFGIGFALLVPANGRMSIIIVIPFFMVSIELMKKDSSMDWVKFNNIFNE